jgi:secreted protein with Ig-like and vWFA domain
MAFIIDASGSIDITEMNQQKTFLVALIDDLEASISSGDVRISVSSFGTLGSFLLGFSTDVVAIKAAINGIALNQGATNILEGICYGYNEIVANGRVGVDKQILLLTDGVQN